MSDDRPKKSWREIDQMRDGSSGGSSRRDKDGFNRDKASKSTAYSSYKSNLDKLFTPGGGAQLPEHLKAKLGPASAEDKEKQALTSALREKADATSLKAYVDAGLELPQDPRFLMKLLEIDDQALLVVVLETLLDIVESGKRPNRMLLLQKIDALTMRYGDGEAVDAAKTLRAALS